MNDDARALDERIIELQRAEFVIRSVRNSAMATKEYLETHEQEQPVEGESESESESGRVGDWDAAAVGLDGAVRELESAFDALGIARIVVDPEVHQHPLDEAIRRVEEDDS